MPREGLDRAVERARLVVGLEREGDPPVLPAAQLGAVRDCDEACVRVRVVADVGREHDEPVQRRRALAGDRDLGRIGLLRDLRRRVGGRPRGDRGRLGERPEQLPALVERRGVGADDADLVQRDLGDADEEVPDREDRLRVDRDGESTSRSWVSVTGPETELSIGSTPESTWPKATASTTSANDGRACASASGWSNAHAAALCAPSRPG